MKKNKLKSIFDIKCLPMDFGRFFYVIYRIFKCKIIGCDGKRYRRNFNGGAIVAANHVGLLDPFALGSCFWYRRMYFLASEEVMSVKFFSVLLKGMGCIKVDRSISDIDAVRKSVEVLKKEHTLGIFPQGHIESEDNLTAVKSGAVLIALQSGAPIVPVYSSKSRGRFTRRVFVVGSPFYCSDYSGKKFPSVTDIERISNVLVEKINECREVYLTEVEGDKK